MYESERNIGKLEFGGTKNLLSMSTPSGDIEQMKFTESPLGFTDSTVLGALQKHRQDFKFWVYY